MTSSGTPQEEAAAPAVPDPVAAVLYVCADRGTLMPSLAAERAEEEGRTFAQRRGLTITEVVTDEFGEPDPSHRAGWQRVRALAEAGVVGAVLFRWPASIAPEGAHEFRYRETAWLQEHGVRVRYTWAPLSSTGGEIR
ncbi:hypothetical protein [Streptomyces sp. AC627_RSS907]|uniref:hypothetical protein n=1 Tax=Streptomyces sp. AC627_RSS907 TaxID=2823684 RepID=UPI0020B86ADC|nr:hypothetical protein [Streptomyces sp. AC627_RSS907]